MALIGKVVAMTGVAYLITDNGTKRELQLGDEIQTGDTIQTPRGVDVNLELATGRLIHIGARIKRLKFRIQSKQFVLTQQIFANRERMLRSYFW